MKKITKKIMALMLSLVMVFGCIPSFTNEASANGGITKTIAEILTTNNNFPTSTSNEIPDKAWVSDKESIAYRNNNNQLVFENNPKKSQIATTNQATSNDGGATYSYTFSMTTYKFVMTEGILTSIEVSGYSGDNEILNGIYGPILGKIAEVLETAENGFPSTLQDGWVAEDGSRAYFDNTNPQLKFVDYVGRDIGDIYADWEITPDGDNYKYSNIIFNMTNKKLTSIKYDGKTYNPTIINGDYLGIEGDLAYDLNATLGVTASDSSKWLVDSQSDWYNEYNENDKELLGNSYSNTTKIQERKDYYKRITLKAKPGYKFDPTNLPAVNISGVEIINDSKEIKDNKFTFIIKKFADGKTTITFADNDGDVVDNSKVEEIKITSFTIVGGDNKTYTYTASGTDDALTTKNTTGNGEITITPENSSTPLDATNSNYAVIKEQTYTVKVEVDADSNTQANGIEKFKDSSYVLPSWDDLKLTNTFNNAISGTDTWIVRNPRCYVEGNKLYFTMTLETRYIKNIQLEGDGSFPNTDGKCSYSYKAPADANYTVDSTTWYKELSNKTLLENGTLEDNKTYYAEVVVTPKDGYKFSNKAQFLPTISSYDGIVTDCLDGSSETSRTCLVRKETPKSTTLTHKKIENKQDIAAIQTKIASSDADKDSYLKLDPQYSNSIGVAYSNQHSHGIGKYVFSTQVKNGYTDSQATDKYEKGIDTNSITKVSFNGTDYVVYDTKNEAFETRACLDLVDYLKDYKVLVVTNGSTFVDAYSPYTAENQCAEIYELYNFGKAGSITFSGLTIGNEAKNITASGNLGPDGTLGERKPTIFVQNGSSWDLVPDGEKLEKDKVYKINFYIENDKYDINELTINGQEVTIRDGYTGHQNDTGCNVNYSALTQSIYVSYKFTPQVPSSGGGSSSYKAVDKEKTTEKITGTGKKGSKRVVIPQEGRKVQSVTVTDKKGNKVEVTLEKDGTYSFIQPASDVDVKVNYKNRLIELTIGSLDASVDDVHHQLDVVPKVVNDRTMLPIRFVAENLGAKVDWDEKDPDTVVITRGDTRIEITLGSDIAKVNGQEYKLDSVAFAENDRTYLPVRFVSEKLNAIVEWNEAHPMDVKIYERQ